MTPDSSPPPGSPAGLVLGDTRVLELGVLGPPALRWGEQEVHFRTRKAFALLAYLALSRIPQSREQLASLLWPDHEEGAARTLLRTTLSQLRHHLGAVTLCLIMHHVFTAKMHQRSSAKMHQQFAAKVHHPEGCPSADSN